MSTKKKIVIQDACILFDLVEMDLLGLFFKLDLEAYTTPQVIAEILESEQLHALGAYLEKELAIDRSGSLEDIQELESKYPALSFPDSSVLESALRNRVIVLSSDGSLRKICQANNLEVHGFLWIIEQMYVEALLSVTEGVDYLTRYSKINPRAPKDDIQILIQKLNSRKI